VGLRSNSRSNNNNENGSRLVSVKPSPKIQALIKHLVDERQQDGTVKSVVFSQWTSFLDLIQACMRPHAAVLGHVLRFDGTMNAKQREETLRRFSADPQCTVLLASLKAGGVGLNLTAANHVYLCDQWWNLAVEEQACDRIYRVGQQRPVRVFRFVIEESIEDRIIQLQALKKEMFEQLFGENPQRSQQRRLDMLKLLLLE